MSAVGDDRVELAGSAIPELKPARRRRLPLTAALTYVASIALGIGVWQLASMHWSSTFLPSPYQTWIAAKELWRDGTLPASIWASSRRILIGWSLGLVVGVPIGLLMGRIQVVRRLLDPYIEFFRFIPPI